MLKKKLRWHANIKKLFNVLFSLYLKDNNSFHFNGPLSSNSVLLRCFHFALKRKKWNWRAHDVCDRLIFFRCNFLKSSKIQSYRYLKEQEQPRPLGQIIFIYNINRLKTNRTLVHVFTLLISECSVFLITVSYVVEFYPTCIYKMRNECWDCGLNVVLSIQPIKILC